MKTRLAAIALLALSPVVAGAQNLEDEVVELRELVVAMKADYETRIAELETRLDRAERLARGAQRDAGNAIELAEETAISASAGSSAPNVFNPAIGAVLTGYYADVGAGWSEIPGFQPAGEIGTGSSGFSVGEAEINLKASVDTLFYGNFTAGIHEDEGATELEIEEASVQTMAMPAGLTIMGGRFFSAAGYLNSFHFHADDFVDRPLPYQAFLGSRYSIDGVRASWIAPTPFLLELGTELNWGGGFPASANHETSPGAWTAYAKLGGDVGFSNSWQAGVSYISADDIDRAPGHVEEGEEPETFTGDSDLTIVDFVWKWAPQGNPTVHNFKLQGEYFARSESGTYADIAYDGDQAGWYLQGVWQFAQRWRAGLRFDAVDADNEGLLAGTELEDPGRSSRRTSVMLDWSPSEFSRLRLQYANDRVLPESDDIVYLQYIMSLGAHGAHQF